MPHNALYYFINDLQLPIKAHEKKEHALIKKTHFQLNIPDLPYKGISADYTETGRKVMYFINIAPESPELLLEHTAFFGFTLERPFHLSVDHDDLSHCTGEFQNKSGERLIVRVYVDAFGHVMQVSLKQYATSNDIEGVHMPIDTDLRERIIQCAKPCTDLFHHLVEKKWATVLSLETDLKQLDKDVASLWQGIEKLSHADLNDKALEMKIVIKTIQDRLQVIDRYNDYGHIDPRSTLFQKQLETIQKRAAAKPSKLKATNAVAIADDDEEETTTTTTIIKSMASMTLKPAAPVSLKTELTHKIAEIKILMEVQKESSEDFIAHLITLKNAFHQLTEQLLLLAFSDEKSTKKDKRLIKQVIKQADALIRDNKENLLNNFLDQFQTALLDGNIDDVQRLLSHAMEADDEEITNCFEELFNEMGDCEDEALTDRYIVMGEYLYNHSPHYRNFILDNSEQGNKDIHYVIDRSRYVENLLFELIFESSINQTYSPLLIKKLLAQVDLKTKCLALVNLLILPDTDVGYNLGYHLLSDVYEYSPEFFSTHADYLQGIDERMEVSGGSQISLLFYNNNKNSSPCGVFDIAPTLLQAIIDELLTLTLVEQRALLNRFKATPFNMSLEFNRAVTIVSQVLNSVIAGISNECTDAETMIELLDKRAAHERACQLGWGLNFYVQALQMLKKFLEKFAEEPHRFERLYTHVIKNIVNIPDWERKALTNKLFTAPEIVAIRQRAKEDKSPVSAEMGRNSSGFYTPVKNPGGSNKKLNEVSPNAVADSDNTLFLPIGTPK